MMKRRMRSLLAVVLFTAILCIGCGSGKKDEGLYLDDKVPETKVTLFTQNEEVSTAIEERCKEVLNTDGTTNIVVYNDMTSLYADENLTYREALLKRLTSKTADDLFVIPGGDVIEFDQKGYIYDLSDLDCVDSLSKDALVQSTYNDKVFSLPLSYTGFGLIWNVDMLERYGLKVPENIEEFWAVCETLKSEGILPYGANNDCALYAPVMCKAFADIYQGSDSDAQFKALSDGTVPVSTYLREGYEFLQTMIDKGYMDPQLALQTKPSIDPADYMDKTLFQEEKCAFICTLYRGKAFEDYSFSIEMAPFPILEDGSVCLVGADHRLAVNPNSKNIDSAIAIVEALGQSEVLDSFANKMGMISASKNATAPDIPQSKRFVESIAGGGQVPNMDLRVHFNVLDDIAKLSCELCKGESVEEVCAEHDKRQMEDIAAYAGDEK